MLRNGRSIRIYVRNKDRYNIESKKREFLYVEVADFAGTTIGEVKENVQRQCGNSLRLDALYLNNQPLANDRSVAHYNLEDETILETTSNPFWVSCLYVKAAEVKQLQQGRPEDDDVQKWTQKSLPKKYVLISLLFNSKNEFKGQPPHFPTLDDFVLYLEQYHQNKKGATMHPDYTQKDLRAFEREFRSDFMGRYNDPLAAFLDHYAVRLGYLDPEDIEPGQGPVVRPIQQVPRAGGRGNAAGGRGNVNGGRGNAAGAGERQQPVAGRRREQRACDDCEVALAEVYCTDCPGGLALCRPCSAVLHAGATRRRHTQQDVAQAPKVTKPYVPRAFLAPFAIVVAMYSAMTSGRLSVTEEEIKRTAQSLTDTDLQDKQHGKYVGGFDCMENVLIAKGFVQKEAARVPTYALTEAGQVLGEKLFKFYTAFYKFSEACRLPKVTNCFRSCVIGNRQLCLLIDERERDRDRLLRFAADKQIGAQVRMLPAGDYVWILTPPMVDPHLMYTGRDYDDEQGSGIKNCFYLVEGSASGTKYSSTHQQQDFLKSILEKLTTEHGFYVNYTSSWMKSAQWLLWFSSLILEALRMGHSHEERISYTEYMSRAARQHGAAVAQASFTQAQRNAHKWTAQLFIDHIFRDSLHERSLLSTVQEDLRTADRHKHLLIIENLQQYNKRRQSTLSKCCEAVHTNPEQATEIVEEKIGPNLHNMVHYDIPSYWQLYIQVIVGVYVVRTESDQERDRIQQRFLAGPQDPPTPPSGNNKKAQKPPGKPRQTRKKATATVQSHTEEPDRITAGQLETDNGQVYNRNHLQPLAQINRTPRQGGFAVTPRTTALNTDKSTVTNHDQFRRKAVIHTIDSVNIPGDLNRLHNDGDFGPSLLTNAGQPDRSEWSRKYVEPADRGEDCKDSRQLIQPFSGKGFCLGSSIALETSGARDKNGVEDGGLGVGAIFPKTTRDHRDRNPGVGGTGGMATSGYRDSVVDRISGLLGGTRDREITAIGEGIVYKRDKATDIRDGENNFADDIVYRSGTETCGTAAKGYVYRRGDGETVDEQGEAGGEFEDQLDAVALDAEDFIDSQNEEDVLNEILTKSAAEVTKTSNEDQMYRLALELSRKEATIGMTSAADKDEDLLQKVIEQSKREANSGRSVIHPGHLDLNRSQVNSPNKIGNETKDDIVISHDEDEMLRKTIELGKRMTPVKKDPKNVTDLASLPEDEKVTLALERSLLETKGLCSEHDSAVDEKVVKGEQGINTRRAVKRKIIRNEGTDSCYGESAIVVEDEDKSGNVTEDEEVGRAAELGKLSTTGNAEDNEMREALERSLIEHSPRKKSRRNYDRELSHAIERSLTEGKCDSSFVESDCNNSFEESPERDADEDLKMALDQSLDNHSPRKKPKLGTTGIVTPISKPSAKGVLEDNLELMGDSQYRSSSVVEKAYSTKICYGDSKDSSFDKIDEIETSCDFTTDGSNRKRNGISDISSLRLVMQEHNNDLSESIDENGAIVNELGKEEDSDTEDLVPPSPDKLSQSLTTTRNRRSILSDASTKKTPKQRENTDKRLGNKNKIRNGKEKSRGFDLRSSLFGTGDSSENESDYESDENIFEDEADITGIQYESVNSCTENMLASHKDGKDNTVALEIKPKKNNCEESGYVNDLADTAEETVDKDVELDDTEYDCDDDNDIDYQPGTQEPVDSQVDKDNDNDSDNVDTDEDDGDADLSDDILPVIRGPRSKLYKDLKAKEEKLLQQKLSRTCSEDMIEINKENKEHREAGREKHHDEDFEIARTLQEELNREHPTESQRPALIDDEEYAKQLQSEWNKPLKESAIVEVPTDDVLIENDEEYARRLQAELDSGLNNPTVLDHTTSSLNKRNRNQRQNPGTGTFGGDSEEEGSEELVRELQKRELEKIERMKKSLERDENLAKELQNLDAGTAVSGVQRREDIATTQASFKQHVAVQKTGREQTLSQLRQYRHDQMERYHNGSDTVPAGRKHVPAAAVVDLTHEQDNFPGKQNPDNFPRNPEYLENPNSDWEEQWFRREDANTPFTQREAGFNQSQAIVGGAPTQPDQSQSTVGGHMTQSSQSQGSNITCGNCGGKGHTRKFVQCPRYHTAEETARREEKAREDRRKKEMKAVQEKIKQQINAEKDEKKKQEIRNMEAVVMSAQTEFQTTMNQLRNIIQQVGHLSRPDPETTGNAGTKPRRKQRKK